MVWRVESTGARAQEADELADSVRAGRKPAVYGPDGCGKTSLLGDVTRRLGEQAVLVRVPGGLDQVESVTVHIAAALGDDALREVDAALRERAEQIEPSLEVLSRHLGDHLLVVDDIDAFTPEGSHDLRGVAGRRGAPLSAWLRQHAALWSSADRPDEKGWTATPIAPLREPPSGC